MWQSSKETEARFKSLSDAQASTQTALLEMGKEVRTLSEFARNEADRASRDRSDVWKAIGDWQNSLGSLKISSAPSTEFEQRLARVETQLGELRKLLLDETPKGRPKLSRMGRIIGQAVRRA